MTANSSNIAKLDDSDANGTSNNEISANRVITKLPTFYKTNPSLWFCQIESLFVASGVASERTKYHTVVASIESDILVQVSDIIMDPPIDQPYSALKARILSRFGDSEEKRIKKLLTEMQLGDKRPSFLLMEMRQLGGNNVTDDILKSLWIQQMPRQIQAILSVSSDNLSTLASMADKIYETTSSSEMCSISNSSYQSESLQSQISALTKKIDEMCSHNSRNFHNGRQGNFRNRSRSRSKNNNTGNANNTNNRNLCFYHSKFGDRAKKCREPCSFVKNNSNSGN